MASPTIKPDPSQLAPCIAPDPRPLVDPSLFLPLPSFLPPSPHLSALHRSAHASSTPSRRASMPSPQTKVSFDRVTSEPAGGKKQQCMNTARQEDARNAVKGQLNAEDGAWRPTRATFFGSQDVPAPAIKEFALEVRVFDWPLMSCKFGLRLYFLAEAFSSLLSPSRYPSPSTYPYTLSPLHNSVCSGQELGMRCADVAREVKAERLARLLICLDWFSWVGSVHHQLWEAGLTDEYIHKKYR